MQSSFGFMHMNCINYKQHLYRSAAPPSFAIVSVVCTLCAFCTPHRPYLFLSYFHFVYYGCKMCIVCANCTHSHTRLSMPILLALRENILRVLVPVAFIAREYCSIVKSLKLLCTRARRTHTHTRRHFFTTLFMGKNKQNVRKAKKIAHSN